MHRILYHPYMSKPQVNLSSLRNLVFILLAGLSAQGLAESPVIAVAANLNAPMTKIISEFQKDKGATFRVTYGSSGNLARQIVQGAPYELFISASSSYIEFLFKQGVISNNGWEFANGTIGIYVPEDSRLYKGAKLKTIVTALRYKTYRKIALANPEHAPYGVAAMQALQSAGIWALESTRTLLAEDISQVVPFVLSGNADLAIIPYSFMKTDQLKGKGKYIALPAEWYEPVTQYVVLLENASEITREFDRFLASDRVRSILEDYGYATPELQ
jgi:molybdate transport system substrate-binding protein